MVSYCCVRLKPILSRIVAGTAAEGRHKIASLAERISTAGRWRGWSSSTIDVVTVGRSCVTTSRRTIVLESLGRQADTAGAMAEGPPTLHPVLHPVSFLLGTWRGEGEGGYPTIQSFKYDEEIKLWHSGKPVIAYSQKTWKAASGEPMHTESGYLRFKPDGSMEAVIAQSTGLAEVQVLNIGRIFEVEGDELRYTVEMAIHGHEQQPHLRAVLRKVSGD